MSPIKLGKASTPQPPDPPSPDGQTPRAGEPAGTGELRGYEIGTGSKPKLKARKEAPGESKGISPVILFAAAGAVVVLLLVMVIGPSRPGTDAPTDTSKELSASYKAYLKQQKPPPPDIDEKVRQVEERLAAIAWAERVGRKDVLRRELDLLLMMDTDRGSPIYRYASQRLSRL